VAADKFSARRIKSYSFTFSHTAIIIRDTMKRASILLILLLVCCVYPTSAQTVPTPESVLGHKPGDDFYLASYDESREYLRKLAASSNRIKLITVGKTTRGLDWEITLISSPENLAKLDRYNQTPLRGPR
jgi:hypothetical protein